jgi:flagellar hook-associated protein 3 FlgL
MRITDLMQTEQLTAQLNQVMSAIATDQEELSSGKSLTSPSSDPGATSADLTVRWALIQNAAFTTAAQTAQSALSTTDSALSQLESLLQTAHTLAVEGQSGTQTAADLAALGSQASELLSSAVSLANTQYGDEYVFAGVYGQAPASTTTNSWTVPPGTSTAPVTATIGVGDTVQLGADGNAVFNTSVGTTSGGTAEPTLLGTLSQLASDLSSGNVAGLGQDLQNVSDALNQVNLVRAQVGAAQDRVNAVLSALQSAATQLTGQQGSLEDTNVVSVAANLSMQQSVYEAALQVGAQMILPTLANYLNPATGGG